VQTNPRGYIAVDEYQSTSSANIFALGDVAGQVELTPMAIAAGRRLADRLFGGMPDAKADYSLVPTVVFSHPTIGTIGLTEPQARDQFGSENVKIYTSDFVNLYYGTFYEGNAGEKPVSKYKLVCAGPEERVVGLHIFGKGSDEVLQGFGVAMKMGATKADFDRCVAIHPTAGEE
jgi:glutathione reductase (NADPH)